MKRFISLLLIVAIMIVPMVGCNSGDEESSEAMSTVEKGNEYLDENGKYKPLHTIVDQEGKEFNIIVRGESFGTYQSEDFTTESELYGDLLNDAVAERNNVVEELYGVTLNVYKSDTINNDVYNDCFSGIGAYDAVMPSLSYLATLAAENFLYDLTTIENFDLDAPWWNKNCTDAYSIENRVYFTTGDITILSMVNTPSILFNKEMIGTYGLDNPYDLVKNKEWTFDKMVEMCKAVSDIKTADGSYSDDNIYGLLTSYSDPANFLWGSGELVTKKDGDDIPYVSLNNERAITIAQKILEEFANADYLIFAEECPDPIWVTSLEIFAEGRCLFRPSAFSATTKLRKQSEIEFGILPKPLMDETQTDYVSYCGGSETAGIGIPTSAPDKEYSAYMIEAYAAQAKNYITHAYYDINLRTKDARDDESEEMLDIIFGSLVYDIGALYDVGGIVAMFRTLTQNGSADIASQFESKIPVAEAELEEIVLAFMDGE